MGEGRGRGLGGEWRGEEGEEGGNGGWGGGDGGFSWDKDLYLSGNGPNWIIVS